jgi:hypothetical protein
VVPGFPLTLLRAHGDACEQLEPEPLERSTQYLFVTELSLGSLTAIDRGFEYDRGSSQFTDWAQVL